MTNDGIAVTGAELHFLGMKGLTDSTTTCFRNQISN